MPLELTTLGLSPPSAASNATASTEFEWQWEADWGWEYYEPATNRQLEEARKRGSTSHDVRGPEHTYRVDFKQNTQTNLTCPGRHVRRVRRVPKGAAIEEVATPSAQAGGVAPKPQLQRMFSALSRDPVSDFERKVLDKPASSVLNRKLQSAHFQNDASGVDNKPVVEAAIIAEDVVGCEEVPLSALDPTVSPHVSTGASIATSAQTLANVAATAGESAPQLRVRFFAEMGSTSSTNPPELTSSRSTALASSSTVLQALLAAPIRGQMSPATSEGCLQQRLRFSFDVQERLPTGGVAATSTSPPRLTRSVTGVEGATAAGAEQGTDAAALAILKRLRGHCAVRRGENEGRWYHEGITWNNEALSRKLEHQLVQPLLAVGGVAPPWVRSLPLRYPFLFPRCLREQLLHCTGFGTSHAVRWLQQRLVEARYGDQLRAARARARGGSDQEQGMIWDLHEKVARDEAVFVGPGRSELAKIPSRALLPQFAERVIELTYRSNAMLEVVFDDEQAFGDGVTQSFYTNVATEYLYADGNNASLWVEHSEQGIHLRPDGRRVLHAERGLSPRPYQPGSSASVAACRSFRFVGRVIAKALRDGFVVPLPLSETFLAAVLGEEVPLTGLPQPGDGWEGEVVGAMARFAVSLRAMGANITDDEDRARMRVEETKKPAWARRFMKVDAEASFETYAQACVFCETGAGGTELVDGGTNRSVDISNLDEFVERAADWWLRTGIQPQVDAFRSGIEDVCISPAIWAFEAHELRDLLCGSGTNWTRDDLIANLQLSGGTSKEGRSFAMLVDELDRMPFHRRGPFVEFVTGCSRLPPGGLASAGIKVVWLSAERNTLPRSHTCTNELHLPEYDTPELLSEKLALAMDGSKGMYDSQQ
eukprot:TRINITY_DN25688_c0_g1_i1.p1 TRINITY_DN25688_c0_g1~~TRINITY_DN25688_c0_g1_i1.p1  ORF type:complete len:988 (-),score=153.37 TRINITY_DN25688_c0_g1_i1:323-2962(-)